MSVIHRIADALGVECATTPGFIPSWALARALATRPRWHPEECEHEEFMFPKRPRIVSRAALVAYARAHPRCEIIACPKAPCPEPHHLVSRKMGGGDVDENLLRLCLQHHAEWHQRGGVAFRTRYLDWLRDDALLKIERALRMID